uniref:Uncharacterized protein n=1 Tax=Promethearchaeum syntrophicum TaxID=2594042 RepID=A0A5B9DAW2_9ARCH|nr:hypothetical protein DSAG12_02072 [Candidatus Prometheoarchaeum syntrophicum]
MDITNDACEFIKQESTSFKYDPVVMVFERVYQG